MSQVRFLYIFCYDVSCNRKRARLAAQLEEQGVRVQDSVFEVELSAEAAKRLMLRLEAYLDRGDSLRAYAVSAHGRKASYCLGSVPLLPKEGYVLL